MKWPWQKEKQVFDVNYIQEHNGRYAFVLRDEDRTVEAVSNVRGLPNLSEAKNVVTMLSEGFEIRNEGFSGVSQAPKEDV